MTNAVAEKVRPTSNTYEFTLRDRCDACGAGAYVRATRPDLNSSLFFCGHHAAKNDNINELTRQGFLIDDGRDALYAEGPGASA